MKIYKIFAFALAALFIFGCNSAVKQTASPSDVLKKYFEAYDRKDVAAAKQTFSKGTMKMYEDAARKQQISVDEVVKKQFEAGAANNLTKQVETVGEKIEGDTATVEVKSKTAGENENIPLVKEDGEWKVAFDQYMQTLLERMKQDMNKMPTNPANKN